MELTPMPPFVLIKIHKAVQKERKEKIGSLYYPPQYVYMKRNCQAGEIVKIGEKAKYEFPEMKIGDILICHHLVENHSKSFYVYSDEYYNYYLVTTVYHNGDRNTTFGIWDGIKITPNKDYIFLEVPKAPESDMSDFDLAACGLSNFRTNIAFKEVGHGIVIPKERKRTREEMTEKMKQNTEAIKKLSKWLQFPDMRDRVVPEIKSLESENEQLSKKINAVISECHTVASANPELNLQSGDSIYTLNIACYMQVEFMGKEYIISETKYINAIPQ